MRADLAIRGGAVLTSAGFQIDVDVGIAEGRIIGLGDVAAASEMDAAGLYVLPGFVDVHVHGAGGVEDPQTMAAYLPNTGVTAFVPTLAASSPEDTLAFVTTVAAVEPAPGCAEVLGSHLEGPYLSHCHCGAQPADQLRSPDEREVDGLLDAANGSLKRMTIAPEEAGALDMIDQLTARGVQVSLGHSACSIDQALEAVKRGASSVTHTYNAMAPFHHRAPGLVGAALSCTSLTAELIADGVHVHRAAVLALIRARGSIGVSIVTDGLPPLGLPPGSYGWMGHTVVSDGTSARLSDGTLAGSVSPMLQAVRNLVSWGVPLADAAVMASRGGAALAGVGDRKGSITPGFDADLVLLDSDLQLVCVYCRGVVSNRLGQKG